jgi:hypothetical protein
LVSVVVASLFSAANQPSIYSYAFFHENLFGFKSQSNSKDGFTTYQDYPSGLSVSYPPEWQKIEDQNFTIFRMQEGSAGIMIQIEPAELPEYFIKTPGDLQMTLLHNYLAESKKLQMDYHLKETPGFKLIESNMTTIDGNPAYKLVYLAKPDIDQEQPDRTYRSMDLATLKNNIRYYFMVLVDQGLYDRLLPAIHKIVDSIKITTMY